MIADFTFTKHALERILDMDLAPDEVRKCLEFPWRVHPSVQDEGRSLYYGDRITCVVRDDTLLVVTVVWRTDEAWKTDIELGEYGGREYRGSA